MSPWMVLDTPAPDGIPDAPAHAPLAATVVGAALVVGAVVVAMGDVVATAVVATAVVVAAVVVAATDVDVAVADAVVVVAPAEFLVLLQPASSPEMTIAAVTAMVERLWWRADIWDSSW
ncbi:MAG: hypothetical protein WCI22_11850 [Actinomycetota bacterium]